MTELIRNLTRADEIVRQANPYFEKSAKLREQAEMQLNSNIKLKKIVGLVVGGISWSILLVLTTLLSDFATGSDALSLCLYLPVVLAITFGILSYKAIRKSDMKNFEATIARAEEEAQKGEDFLAQHTDELTFLPVDYWYPLATGYMLKMLTTDRADNLREALSIFDEQLHRWKIEEANAQVVEEQRQQTAHLKKIRTNSTISAVANVGTWLKR